MLIASTGQILAHRVIMADTFGARFIGLLGRREMPLDTALMIKPCNRVHMFFMQFDIGVVFLNGSNQVISKQRLKPWQVSAKVPRAKAVIEIRPEALEQIKKGDILRIKNCSPASKDKAMP